MMKVIVAHQIETEQELVKAVARHKRIKKEQERIRIQIHEYMRKKNIDKLRTDSGNVSIIPAHEQTTYPKKEVEDLCDEFGILQELYDISKTTIVSESIRIT